MSLTPLFDAPANAGTIAPSQASVLAAGSDAPDGVPCHIGPAILFFIVGNSSKW
jgi:hypothetical protein